MIVKSFEIEKLNKSNICFYLIYGENVGQKNQIINNFLTEEFKKNIIRYDENEIIQNQEIFFSEINNKSFFENKKTIIITRVTEKINKVIINILEKKFDDIIIILNSGTLEKKSKLRSIFEKSKNLICIPVYLDDTNSLIKVANAFLKKKNINISQETINLLVERCRGDRENLNNELGKIESFSKNRKNISVSDISILTNLADNYSHSELCDQCLAKNHKKTTSIINQNNYSADDCVPIIRIFLFKTKRLLKLKKDNLQDKNINNVISKFSPPIFWKDKEIVRTQMKNWSYKAVEKLVFELNDIELLIKKNNENALNILFDFLISKSKVNN